MNDNFQSRIQLKFVKLRTEQKIWKFCYTYIVQEEFLINYQSHMKYLNIKQRKRKQESRKLQEEECQKSFNGLTRTDWLMNIFSNFER